MWQSATERSSFTNHQLLRMSASAVYASWRDKTREHLVTQGAGGYFLVWLAFPVFTLAVTGLIYRGVRPELLRYSVVGVAARAFISNTLFYIGQVRDEERIVGTLPGLFLAPCPRLSWLTGFVLGGLLETFLAAGTTIIFGMVAFDVRFDPDFPALLLSLLLFLSSLWGLGSVFSAIGLVLKKSNDLANLLSSLVLLLGRVYYPVALLPTWLRLPARTLPLGYGLQALANAALHHAGVASLAPQLVPLTVFAIPLPVVGIWTFGWLERGVRERGELDLY